MSDLLLITDEAGTVLFHNRKTTISNAIRAVLETAAKENKRGLVMVGNRRAYVKEVPLRGKRHLFFLDFDQLYERFGVAATRAADGLFDVSGFSMQTPKEIPLRTLCRLFEECYAEELQGEGVRPNLHLPRKDITVNVPISAFTFCMSLLVRLAAGKDGSVDISFAEECGRVTVFADGTNRSALSAGERELLTVLLFEAGNAAGFAVEQRQNNSGYTFYLTANPLDIASLGFKNEQFSRYRNTMRSYISMFE